MWKIKPNIVIATTHELLLVAAFYKLLQPVKIFYDVQENYFNNIFYLNTFPKALRKILAYSVYFKEKVLSGFFDGFILAEKTYQKEIKWLKNKKQIVLENRLGKGQIVYKKKSPVSYAGKVNLAFAYTGTIAEDYGIIEALEFVIGLQKYVPGLQFHLIGICKIPDLASKIQTICAKYPFIHCQIQEDPLPYSEIQKVQLNADFLLLPYKTNIVIKNRIPTRLYEGLSMQIPMIIQNNPTWEAICNDYAAAIFIDYNKPDMLSVNKKIFSDNFYKKETGDDLLWETYISEMLSFIES